ncbi:MAG: hypothetical protein ACLR2E_18285 [Lachnospiraceae bacterium]
MQSILQHMFLPLIIMILYRTSGDFMLMKSAVSQVRSEEYIMTAESKGLPLQKSPFPSCDEKCDGSLCDFLLYAVRRYSFRLHDH